MRAIGLACAACAVAALPPLNPWPLEGVVDAARSDAAGVPLAQPGGTGLKRAGALERGGGDQADCSTLTSPGRAQITSP